MSSRKNSSLTLLLGLSAATVFSLLQPNRPVREGKGSRTAPAASGLLPAAPLPTRLPVRKRTLFDPRLWWSLFKQAATDWSAHKDSRLGAALAYYSIFSIGPLILIAIAVAGLVFGQEAVRGEVSTQLTGLLGSAGAKSIDSMLASAGKPREGVIATIIGLGTLVFAAIGVVVQLKDALNTVWEADPKRQAGIWGFLRTYAISLAGVLSLGFLLLVSLLISAALAAFGGALSGSIPESLLHAATFLVSFAVVSVLFGMMFKWLPDANVKWADVWIGAIVTAGLFEVGKFAIGLYIGKEGLASTYGAASSIVVVLIWVYYSAQIVLFGAEFTHVYAEMRHQPNPRAK